MHITGTSIVGASSSKAGAGAAFNALDPRTGAVLEPQFFSATPDEVEQAVNLAGEAFVKTQSLSGADKAQFLRSIALAMEGTKSSITERAHQETALPMARLEGELGRTTSQLLLFADLVAEGSWVDARIDVADPARQPLPKPDVRSMLRPLGPVVVFGASNFPLAFSVAGGDTAAALAAGCPVIVKAHLAHPGTSEIVGQIIRQAVQECGMPEGIFSLLFDSGYEVGTALVQHPKVKAVGFTGSRRGGRALMQAAAARPEPIPVFAEMSSINPVVITSAALQERSEKIAAGLHTAVTQGVGQFCTNPGVVFLPAGEAGDAFRDRLLAALRGTAPGTMLTSGICEAYQSGLKHLAGRTGIKTVLQPEAAEGTAGAALFEIQASELDNAPEILEEVFGPSTLLARYENVDDVQRLVAHLEGQLTATIHMEFSEAVEYKELVQALEWRVGRVIVNGFPTGVEVGHAMVHGGPFPATSDGRSTSVGTRAIERFVRPVCFQDFPEALLPAELHNANPLQLHRLINGQRTTNAIS